MSFHARPFAKSLPARSPFLTRALLITLFLSASVAITIFAVSASGLRGSAGAASEPGSQIQQKRQSNLPASFRTGALFVEAPVASSCVNVGGTGGCFATIQAAVNAAANGDTINVAAGTYDEDVSIPLDNLSLLGAGAGTTSIRGPIGGPGATIQIQANNVTVAGFTITRLGNNTTDWNNPSLNSVGIAIQGLSFTNALMRDNIFTGNRTGIDINNSNGHTIRNNVIDFNRTGMIFRNQTDQMTVVENFITNNWTVGVLFLDGSGGTNSPVQSALNSAFGNNNLSGNWYGQIVDRQFGGSLPAPGTTNLKNFPSDWFGTTTPVVTTANSAEPGYAAQIPVAYGGTATPPGGQPDIAGSASANFKYTPVLQSGTDTNIETTPGRGTFGFQGGPVIVTPAGGSATAADNDYTRINNAIQGAFAGQTIKLLGTFNWTETNAAASWAKGSDGIASNADDYEILVPANLNNVTLTATNPGDATIQGPGDLPAVDLEAVFVFDGGDNQNWTISNLNVFDFDVSIGMFNGAGGSDAFNNTHITNNHIRIAKDLNATVAPADVSQNIGIHFSFGTNIVISGNTIDIQGDGVSDGSNFATEVGMQSNTSGGSVYDGLQITNNTIKVLNAQNAVNPEVILGIWENAHGHTSNITISGNQFINQAAGNNPAINLQRGFRVTSHSSATTTVIYQNNTVNGANIAFQWIAGSNFAGNQPVKLTSNTITNGSTGVLVQSQGLANLSFNRIVGNSAAGINNVDGIVTAENNWWGCNAGPGNTGCNSVLNTGTIDFNPWLQLRITAAPGTISPGGTATATADMTHNSDNLVPSAVIFVPATTVTFGATQGSMAPPIGTLSSGQASSTFTSTSNSNGSASATVDNQTVSTPITVSPSDVTLAVSPASVAEDGVTNLVYTFTRTGSTSAALTVNFSVGGTATFATDYTQSGAATFGATSGTVTFGIGNSTVTVTIDPTPDVLFEPNETAILTVTSGLGYNVASPSAATGTINNDDAAGGIIRFSSATYNTTESSGVMAITVQRVGDTSAAATVDYTTPDDSNATTVTPCATISGAASPRCDFTTAIGTLRWAAGDGAPKTFNVLISQDNYVEGPETLTLTLSNLTGGSVFGVPSTATLTIADDATEPAANPIDDASNFVRQQYHDFLNREPDAAGLAFWTNEITSCGSNQQCIDFKRVQVSAAFYISIEFQDTGYLVERLYKASYGDVDGLSTTGGSHTLKVPVVRFSEFLPDTQEIGLGVVVGAPGWPQALEANKVAFADKFVQRARFLAAFPLSMTPAQFVDALNTNAGNPLSTAERNQLVADLTSSTKTRAQVLRAVSEDQDLVNAEFNRAFVLMQYFGYLRRNPNSAPDSNYSGYDFWLTKLNQFNGNFQNADMVKSFIVSGEYRGRFGTP